MILYVLELLEEGEWYPINETSTYSLDKDQVELICTTYQNVLKDKQFRIAEYVRKDA